MFEGEKLLAQMASVEIFEKGSFLHEKNIVWTNQLALDSGQFVNAYCFSSSQHIGFLPHFIWQKTGQASLVVLV